MSDNNRTFIGAHLNNDVDAELLQWLEDMKSDRWPVSHLIRMALYEFAQKHGRDVQRQDDQDDIFRRLDSIQHSILQAIEELGSGGYALAIPQNVRDDLQRVDDNMLSHLQNTVVKPGMGSID